MRSGGYHFWLGASADADPATHEPSRVTPSRPSGECPLRDDPPKITHEWAATATKHYPRRCTSYELFRAYADVLLRKFTK